MLCYFFSRNVLNITSGLEHSGQVMWPLALCLLLSWMIVFFVLIKGISSLGKVWHFPLLLLTLSFSLSVKTITERLNENFTYLISHVIFTVSQIICYWNKWACFLLTQMGLKPAFETNGPKAWYWNKWVLKQMGRKLAIETNGPKAWYWHKLA